MSFRLQRVLEHRQRREDEMRQRLTVATLARMQAEQQLAALVAEEQRRREEMATLLAGGRVDAARVREIGLALTAFEQAIRVQRAEVARRVEFEGQERAKLTRAMVERKALDRLRERHEENERIERNHKEAVLLDEIGAARAARERLFHAHLPRRAGEAQSRQEKTIEIRRW